MDNLMGLYTSTEGRINRARWWMGVVILIVVNLLISFLILPIFGISAMPNMAALGQPGADVAAISTALANGMRASAWAGLVQFIIFAYPTYALMVKRRHDRDSNGMDALIYMGLTAIMLLIQALGIGYTNAEVPGVAGLVIPQPSLPMSILGLVVGVYAIYLLVVLGFLRGTAGTNSYGPDPLGGVGAPARA